MKNISLSQLIYCDFEIKNITVGQIHVPDKDVVDYTGNARTKNLLHLITEGERIYKINGKTIHLPCGSAFLLPDNTTYESIALAKNSSKVSGIGICFDLFDPNGQKIQLTKDLYSDNPIDAIYTSEKIHLMQQLYKTPLPPVFTLKSVLGQLLHRLCSTSFTEPKDLVAIKPALAFIAEHYNETLPIKAYSDTCNMSESNFRKKFHKCTGMSPIDYRNELRFEKAKQLYTMNMGLEQVAEAVGFSDYHYLAKLYRKCKGSTLKRDTEII